MLSSFMMTVQFHDSNQNFICFFFFLHNVNWWFSWYYIVNIIIQKVGDLQRKVKVLKDYLNVKNCYLTDQIFAHQLYKILRSIVHRFQRRSNLCQSFIFFWGVIDTHFHFMFFVVVVEGTKLKHNMKQLSKEIILLYQFIFQFIIDDFRVVLHSIIVENNEIYIPWHSINIKVK